MTSKSQVKRLASQGAMVKDAVISDCGQYRYLLSRDWESGLQRLVFIGLNPSTADAEIDDPTIRRLIGFSKAWGYGGFDIVNLFALRSKDPKMLCDHDDPIGPLNDTYLSSPRTQSQIAVAM